ncbi:MAG: isoaspartyl peptidase/L-asparaginase [Ignavibacteriaceae bacterium]|jgi:beta-aspartyl-peptidase (threonine type)
MRSLYIFSFLVLFCFSYNTRDSARSKKITEKTDKYTIVIHGGAGAIDKSMPDSIKQLYLNSLSEALKIGFSILQNNGNSLDAVENVIKYFETNPLFNAGIGSVYTSDGTHEMDASIMDGRDLSCGAVAGVKHVPHPISLARFVMEKSPHVLLAYDGAEKFAEKMGIKLVPQSFFDTPVRYKQWQEYKKKLELENHGTVGCVALDKFGNLAAGTSTGGMTGKLPGRIGDSPLIGDGTYANNKTCAVSCTGWGEKFIKHTVAFNVSALMEYKRMTLKQAAEDVIYTQLQPDDGGLIAVDRDGNYTAPFNTSGMFRGVATSSGKFEVNIWK